MFVKHIILIAKKKLSRRKSFSSENFVLKNVFYNNMFRNFNNFQIRALQHKKCLLKVYFLDQYNPETY